MFDSCNLGKGWNRWIGESGSGSVPMGFPWLPRGYCTYAQNPVPWIGSWILAIHGTASLQVSGIPFSFCSIAVCWALLCFGCDMLRSTFGSPKVDSIPNTISNHGETGGCLNVERWVCKELKAEIWPPNMGEIMWQCLQLSLANQRVKESVISEFAVAGSGTIVCISLIIYMYIYICISGYLSKGRCYNVWYLWYSWQLRWSTWSTRLGGQGVHLII